MIALYIIGGITAYLLIGSVVTGLLIRSDDGMADDCWMGIIAWPFILILIIPVVVVTWSMWDGVWDVDSDGNDSYVIAWRPLPEPAKVRE